MMVIEMREAAKDKAFDLLEEIKNLGHQKKMALCELEDTLYECFESLDEDDEDYKEDEDERLALRNKMTSRYRKSAMRDHDYRDADYRRSYDMKSRRGMRMHDKFMD